VKLLCWNVQWFRGIDGLVDPARVVAHARSLCDFDVLCLQEVAVNYPRLEGGAGHDQSRILEDLLPGFRVFFGSAVDEWSVDGQRQQFGNLIATRLPVVQVQHHPLPYPADPGVRSMPRMCSEVTVRDPLLGPVRVMTTHLEFYSKHQRLAQAKALRALHVQALAHVLGPPESSDDGSPFQTKLHTAHAILCGDFNVETHEPEFAVLVEPGVGQFWDGWSLLNGNAPPAPTFRIHDRTYGPGPITCDFVLVSDSLKPKVRRIAVDAETQLSDHQPLFVEII